jgi:hypothetical protein
LNLFEYNFEIKHINGNEDKVVDALSIIRHATTISLCEIELKKQILRNVAQHEYFPKVVEEILNAKNNMQ